MKVKELKEILNELDDEDLVILSGDDEGNDYSPVDDYFVCVYVEDTPWSGGIRLRELTSELIERGYSEEDIHDGVKGVNAVVLYPAN